MEAFLKLTSKTVFWQAHFSHNHFTFNFQNFNWLYFRKIPFCNLEEISLIGLEYRLKDAQKIIQKNTYKLWLRIPYRKTKGGGYRLHLDVIPMMLKKDANKYKEINLSNSYGINLRLILLSVRSPSRKDVIVVDPNKIGFKMKILFEELEIESISCEPSDILKLNILDDKSKNRIMKLTLMRPFKNQMQKEEARRLFPNALFNIRYPLIGVTSAIRYCSYAQKHHGLGAVHPRKKALIELININDKGVGEIIITTLNPAELAWIRYKTKTFGKAIFEKCECGEKVTLVLRRIKKFNFSIASGTLARYS